MIIHFRRAIREIEAEAGGFTPIVRDPTAVQRYLFLGDMLQERNAASYIVEASAMAIRPTLAGFSGMDSEYAPAGSVVSEHMGPLGLPKITAKLKLPEATLREIQQRVAGMDAASAQEIAGNTVLNLLDVTQRAVNDRKEHMAATALFYGALDASTGYPALNIQYGYDTDNLFPERVGADAYDAASSDFWADFYAVEELFGGEINRIVGSYRTVIKILRNPANDFVQLGRTIDRTNRTITFRVSKGSTVTANALSPDERDVLELVAYRGESNEYNPEDLTALVKRPFVPDGRLLFTGAIEDVVSLIDAGDILTSLGYVHTGPTVEGGDPGNWGRVYVPQDEQFQVRSEAIANSVPVVNRNNVAVLRTQLT